MFEAKNQERMNIWSAIEQSEAKSRRNALGHRFQKWATGLRGGEVDAFCELIAPLVEEEQKGVHGDRDAGCEAFGPGGARQSFRTVSVIVVTVLL